MHSTLPVFCLVALFAIPASAEGPALPVQHGLGSECGPLLSCPWSGPFAAHVTLGGQWWGEGRPGGFLHLSLGASLARWAELGAQVSTLLREPAGPGGPLVDATLFPLTLWGRFTPRLAGGFRLGAELRGDFPAAPFSGGAYRDAQTYSLLFGHESRLARLHLSLAYQEAGARSYGGVQAGAGLALLLGGGLSLHAEALALAGAAGTERTTGWAATVGLRIGDRHGAGAVLSHTWAEAPHLPGSGLAARLRVSVGPEYLYERGRWRRAQEADDRWRRENWQHLARALLWLGGYRDPIVGADGWIYDDSGQQRIARYGTPDPARPGWIRPDHGPAPVRAGTHVYVRREDGAVRATDGAWLGWAQPAPAPAGGAAVAQGQRFSAPPAMPLGFPPPPEPQHPAPGPAPGAPRRGPGIAGLQAGGGGARTLRPPGPGRAARAPADPPGGPPLTFWTAGRRDGEADVRREGAPPAPPSIPVRPQPPEPLPPEFRGGPVPEPLQALRDWQAAQAARRHPGYRPPPPPPAASAAAAAPALQPMAPAPPRPAPPAPDPEPQPAPGPRGGARGAAIDAAMPAAARPPPQKQRFSTHVKRETVRLARGRPGEPECEECGVPTTKPQIDHMEARSKGGSSRNTNAAVLCETCNRAKSDRPTVPWVKNPIDPRMPFAAKGR